MKFIAIIMLFLPLFGCMRSAGPIITNSMNKQVTVTVTYKTGHVDKILFDPCKVGVVGHPDDMVESVRYHNSIVKMPYANNDELNEATSIHVFEERLLVLPTSTCIPKQQ